MRSAPGRHHDQRRDAETRQLTGLLDADRAGVPATPGWLSGQLGLTSAATTALIDRLERAGHVTRRPSSADRRRVELRVSDRAVDLGWEYFGPLLRNMMAAMGSFTPHELHTVERFLHEVTAAAHWPSDPARPDDRGLGS